MRIFAFAAAGIGLAANLHPIGGCSRYCEESECPGPTLVCNPIVAPRYDKCYTLDFTGEFLYWYWSSSALDYMVTGQGIPNGEVQVVNVPVPGRSFFPDYHFDPGFRIGAMVHFGNDNLGYDLGVKYTCFYPEAKGEFDRSKDLRIRAVGTNWVQEASGGADIVHQASLDAAVQYNLFECLAGYTFALHENLFLRPFAGLAGNYIRAKLKVFYDFTDSVRGDEIAFHRSRYSGWGIGPEVGVESTWSATRNWSFFFSGQIALPLIRQKIQGHQTLSGAAVGELNTLRSKVEATRVAISQQCMAGPRWDYWFGNNRYHVKLQAAGEFTFLSAAHAGFINSTANESGLGGEMVGISASAELEF